MVVGLSYFWRKLDNLLRSYLPYVQQQKTFQELNTLRKPQEVTLGDGHVLEATTEGTVATMQFRCSCLMDALMQSE